jgi:hypothetical protein
LHQLSAHGFPLDFTHEREYLLNQVFEFHHILVAYVQHKYQNQLHHPDREAVSVHFRLGSAEEPWMYMLKDRAHAYPSARWYGHIMTKEFDPAKVIFMVFSDNIPGALKMINSINNPNLEYHVVDEDFVTSMLVMSLCKHHINTMSTYSYWGAYLDKHQPTGGKVFFPPHFREMHSNMPLPFEEWCVIPEP